MTIVCFLCIYAVLADFYLVSRIGIGTVLFEMFKDFFRSMQTFFKKLCCHLDRQSVMMNSFDQRIDNGFVFLGIRIVFAHKLIQIFGISDNIKAENISAVDIASCCENHLTAVIDKCT